MIKKVKKEIVKAAAPKKAKAKSKVAPNPSTELRVRAEQSRGTKKETAKKTKLVKAAPKIIAAPKKVDVPPCRIARARLGLGPLTCLRMPTGHPLIHDLDCYARQQVPLAPVSLCWVRTPFLDVCSFSSPEDLHSWR